MQANAEASHILGMLEFYFTTFTLSRSRRSGKRPAIHPSTVAKTLQTATSIVNDVTQNLNLVEYLLARGMFDEAYRLKLSGAMYDAFRQHGPLYHRSKYPKAAINHSIAMILASLGIEPAPDAASVDPDATSAARIGARRRPQCRKQR